MRKRSPYKPTYEKRTLKEALPGSLALAQKAKYLFNDIEAVSSPQASAALWDEDPDTQKAFPDKKVFLQVSKELADSITVVSFGEGEWRPFKVDASKKFCIPMPQGNYGSYLVFVPDLSYKAILAWEQ